MKKHHWKRLFFLLLGLNIAVTGMMFLLISIPAEDQMIPEPITTEKENVSFAIHTNKEDLNRIIHSYLEKEKSRTIEYSLKLADEGVVLFGKLPIFGNMLNVRMTFEPIAQENGDLILNQKKISIGNISLPVSFLLNIIKETYQFPDWVVIQPNKERIYVSFRNMRAEQ